MFFFLCSCFRIHLLWRSRGTGTREYPARCKLTSTSAMARGRGANTSASPTCLLMVIIINICHTVITRDMKGFHMLHTLHLHPSCRIFLQFLTSIHYSLLQLSTCHVKFVVIFLVGVFDAMPGTAWLQPVSESRRCEGCLFCSETTFPSDEVYLLSDRASERC